MALGGLEHVPGREEDVLGRRSRAEPRRLGYTSGYRNEVAQLRQPI